MIADDGFIAGDGRRSAAVQHPYTAALVADGDQHGVSVVISTYERPDACERALRSVLAQSVSPLEVLVCDNGSTDETETRMHAWEGRDERVRYLRVATNSGTPATTRNMGLEHARGHLVAFLDDDDEWLPGKLAAQHAALETGGADLVAANAVRGDDSLYFRDAPRGWHPTQVDLLRANPIITSTAVVRRDRLVSAGGFPTDLRLRGLEDYATWMELARRGVRILVLGEPLVRYDDASGDRLSVDRARIEVAVARLAWRQVLRRPVGVASVRTALRRSAGALIVVGAEALKALRAGARADRRG
jgi:glycosyltransferase involved in cell wall biosynthesis